VTDIADMNVHASGAPLSGRSVVVTRTAAQAAALAEPLEALGAEVLAFPVLETVDPEDWGPADAAIAALADYDWVVLTSTNGVGRFLRRFKAVGGSREALLGSKFAAVGSATAACMRKHGIPPTLVPDDFRAEGLVEAFRELGAGPGWRVLVARAQKAREVFPDALRELGARVDVAPVYRTVPAEPDPVVIERLRAGTVDCVTFTSGAIAKAFVSAMREAAVDVDALMGNVAIASVGPVTTHALAVLGYEDDIEAKTSTMPALAEAIAAYYEARI
jgi:uroporphyrinogen-III synthase